MHKINFTEKTSNCSNENLPAWYKEKVKVMAEIIMKKELTKRVEIASAASRPRNDAHRELEVMIK